MLNAVNTAEDFGREADSAAEDNCPIEDGAHDFKKHGWTL